MAEITTFRKNKIELKEYDYSRDVLNRVLMASFTPQDADVLEEILYSSLRIPVSVLEQNLDMKEGALTQILDRLAKTGLFKVVADHVLVDKEMRKYYEFQILKFEEGFEPGMEFLQGLLRKVPIHILPTWYSISRTSNNIFESIVEKYLETPLIFQRYLMDLNFTDPVQKGIMNALYQSPRYEIDAKSIIEKYELSQEEFEEHMLVLEFNFVGCVKYVREKGHFKQVITPFNEWKEYLCHVRDTEPSPILDEESIERAKESEFGVIEEMSELLTRAQKAPVNLNTATYYGKKLCSINLADTQESKLVCTSDSEGWLKMSLVDRSLYLYRHPLNQMLAPELPEELCNARLVREAEKSLSRIASSGWIYLDDFIKGIYIPLKEEHEIRLVRLGRTWKYQLPEYSQDEIAFFKAIVQNWLFELGFAALGTHEGRECFTLTPLGRDLFNNE